MERVFLISVCSLQKTCYFSQSPRKAWTLATLISLVLSQISKKILLEDTQWQQVILVCSLIKNYFSHGGKLWLDRGHYIYYVRFLEATIILKPSIRIRRFTLFSKYCVNARSLRRERAQHPPVNKGNQLAVQAFCSVSLLSPWVLRFSEVWKLLMS